MKKKYVIDRLEKAIYMGFILDKKSNDYLGKKIELDFKIIKDCISNYNNSISNKGYSINLTFNSENADLQIRTLGEFIYLNPDDLSKMIRKLEDRISKNLSHALRSYTDEGIEIFDLDLLTELKRTGITTMGDTYLAFNNRKYIVHFSHLYSIITLL